MAQLVWDKPKDRTYESGLDQGVLYLPDGSAVPWNGLTSIVEKFDKSTSPVYFDGMKVNDLVVLGDFSATMSAVTYPDEFTVVEGLRELRRGTFFGDQAPQSFGLAYRIMTNDGDTEDLGYKIHILYNVTAIPHDKTYASMSDQPSLVEFQWDIVAVPEEIAGFRPTAHIALDSRTIDPWLLEEIEAILYGSDDLGTPAATLMPMPDLITYMTEWFRVKVVDNGDGTWTATSHRDGYISYTDDPLDTDFVIAGVNAVYLDDVTFQLSDTMDIFDVPQIAISYNVDGTWTASTDRDGLIVEIDAETYTINNAEITYLDPDTYIITNTTE